MSKTPFQLSEADELYTVARPVTRAEIIDQARQILADQFRAGVLLTNPHAAREYLILHYAELEHEVFACIFLDNRHRVLAFEQLFRGTINAASVHPREVVKAALRWNAAAVILAHNHPSGIAEPSEVDIQTTERLTSALALIDVSVLDHLLAVCRTFLRCNGIMFAEPTA